MRVKFIVIAAVGLLLAACGSAPEEIMELTSEGESAAAPTPPASPQIAALPAPTPPVATGPAPGSAEEFVIDVGDRVFFDTDKSDLQATARKTLERQAAWLQKYPNYTISVEGHCDERGTREYNLALGERRATAVKNYLVALGVDPNRIATISYGKERPEALGSNDAAWSQNRRGVSIIGG
jgi:peptidoglycan-associated lipoprotein